MLSKGETVIADIFIKKGVNAQDSDVTDVMKVPDCIYEYFQICFLNISFIV